MQLGKVDLFHQIYLVANQSLFGLHFTSFSYFHQPKLISSSEEQVRRDSIQPFTFFSFSSHSE